LRLDGFGDSCDVLVLFRTLAIGCNDVILANILVYEHNA
jgi:hypothetical protein